jgi:hypothetical protein
VVNHNAGGNLFFLPFAKKDKIHSLDLRYSIFCGFPYHGILSIFTINNQLNKLNKPNKLNKLQIATIESAAHNRENICGSPSNNN